MNLASKLREKMKNKSLNTAVNIDFSKFLTKKYINPFELNLNFENFLKSSIIGDLKKSMSSRIFIIVDENKNEYKTADDKQANPSQQKQVKTDIVAQGTKCKDFKLVCKLQSLGDSQTLRSLEKEIKSTQEEVNDIMQY